VRATGRPARPGPSLGAIGPPGRLVLAATGAAGARALLSAAGRADRPAGRLIRTNYAGRPVGLIAGPVMAVVGSLTAYAAAPGTAVGRSALLVGLAGGLAGAVDDLADAAPDKGVAGHLAALHHGRITTGLVKAVGLSVAGVLAAGPVATGPAERLVAGGLIAGSANLVNLFDLRPGRALKVTLLVALPLVPTSAGRILAGPMGAAAALLPADLAEQTMLGDTGANAVGGLVGLALSTVVGRRGRAGALAAVTGLTVASEVVSFSAVIARTSWLRRLDRIGRGSPAAC